MTTALLNIQSLSGIGNFAEPLRGSALAKLESIHNAFVIIENDRIASFGSMNDLQYHEKNFSQAMDCTGSTVLPCWCDSHTHLVFGSDRESEFVDKIRGLSYAEIAERGGGILNSARMIASLSEDELYRRSLRRLDEVQRSGTGAIEIKSGYGLSVEGELKMLRVIKRLKQESKMLIKATFLGAHAYPLAYKDNHEDYIRLVIDEMLPPIAAEGLADYIDVFCEQNFFSPEETERICLAGEQYGLKPKIHANQLGLSGGVQTGVQVNALSVDHLECMDEDAIDCLGNSNTIGTLLPTAAFFLRMPYQPARRLIDRGCAIALASDYNPGSSPSGNMNFVVALSSIQMQMLPEEAINAATINGAFAMEVQEEAGSIAAGKKANLIITKPINSLASLPYSFGNDLIRQVMIAGAWIR